jgi:hypothetical protein
MRESPKEKPMYQLKTRSIQKVLLASATLAVASFLTTVPASGCAVSAGAKPKTGAALAPAAAMALGVDNAAVSSSSRPKAQAFVGLWDIKLYSEGQFFDEGFDMFHNDGTELLNTQDNPITENVCPGVWEQTGPSTIKVKHPSWYFDTNGNLLGTVIIYETLTLDCDDTFHGTSTEDVYDLQGNKIGHYTGFTIKGNRIKL